MIIIARVRQVGQGRIVTRISISVKTSKYCLKVEIDSKKYGIGNNAS